MLRLVYRPRLALASACSCRTRVPTAALYKIPLHGRYTTGPSNGNSKGGSNKDGSTEDGSESSKNPGSKEKRRQHGSHIGGLLKAVWYSGNIKGFLGWSAMLSLFANSSYAIWHDQEREKNIYSVFLPHEVPEPPHYVDRPSVIQAVKKTLKSSPSHYDVIVGNHGTGKTTSMRLAVSRLGGVVYVYIPDDHVVSPALTKALIDALKWQPTHLSWAQVILQTLFPTTREPAPEIPMGTDYRLLLDEFAKFAKKFKDEYHRHAVLLFDNINVVAKYDPQILSDLQGLAKFAADNNLYKVVFVCSDGLATVQMEENSSWSRGPRLKGSLRIGDLTESEANNFLTGKRKIDPVIASKIIQLCGTRIQTLKVVCDHVDENLDINDCVATLKGKVWSKFKYSAEAINQHRAAVVAKRIIEHGPLPEADYYSLSGDVKTGREFLSRNVFAITDNDLYGFEDKIIEDAVRDGLKSWKTGWF